MISEIGLQPASEMTRVDVFKIVENSDDGWGHIRSKCQTIQHKIEMMVWASKVASIYLGYGGSFEAARFWLMDMMPNLAQAILSIAPKELLDTKVNV